MWNHRSGIHIWVCLTLKPGCLISYKYLYFPMLPLFSSLTYKIWLMTTQFSKLPFRSMSNEADLSVLCIFCSYSLFSQKHNQHLVNSIYIQWSFFFLFLLDHNLSTARIMYFFREKEWWYLVHFLFTGLSVCLTDTCSHYSCMSERKEWLFKPHLGFFILGWSTKEWSCMWFWLWLDTGMKLQPFITELEQVHFLLRTCGLRTCTHTQPSWHSALITSFACSKSVHDFLFPFVSSLNSSV